MPPSKPRLGGCVVCDQAEGVWFVARVKEVWFGPDFKGCGLWPYLSRCGFAPL